MQHPTTTKRSTALTTLARRAGATLCALALAAPVLADGGVAEVYVFNGGANNEGKKGDTFANAAQGWIFGHLGLLDANGKPPTVDGDDLKHGDTVVGKVLRDGNGDIVGYESANGKKRAYNVDTSATTRDAWEALSDDGQFVIAKHGSKGGITLDDGQSYSGFKEEGTTQSGTGANTGNGPYVLPGKPGGTVNVYANSCYSSNDPAGPVGSVTGSADGVDGVTGTQGNDGLIYKGTWLHWTGGTADEIDAARKKLNAAAKKAGFKNKDGDGDFGKWMASLPFPDQYETIEETIDGTGATFRLEYTKSPNSGYPGNSGSYYTPVEVLDSLGGTLFHQNGPQEPYLELDVPPGCLFGGPETMQLLPLPPADPMIPRGLAPASYFGAVHEYGLFPELQIDPAVPAYLRLGFDPDADVQGVYELQPDGRLVPVAAFLQPDHAQVEVRSNGVWVVLEDMLGDVYCTANPNSTGRPGLLDAEGSPVVADNDVTLTASQLPAHAFGYVLASTQQGFTPNPGGSMGNLCLDPPIGRGVGNVIFSSGGNGMAVVEADLTCMPTPSGPVAVAPGDTWNFQVWHRDSDPFGQSTSNFTDAVSIQFQ